VAVVENRALPAAVERRKRMTNYLITERENTERLKVGDDDVALTLKSRWALTIDDGEDTVRLEIAVNERVVSIEAGDLSELLHPLIAALRILLTNGTMGEDQLDDAWGSPS
jgi:hypothetical protein